MKIRTTAVWGLLLVSIPMIALAEEPTAQNFTPVDTQAAGQHPLAPNEAIKRLRVPPGFQITLAAAEPEVRQPIAITFDDRGRLWVAESYSYDGSTFTDQLHDRILIFEDSNGDGVLDRRRIFCDHLTHLTGLEIGFGGVWITAPPHLAFIPDADRDDVPDGEPVIHLDGWSLKAEHNSVNGLTWGPDGWLYGRHGIKQPSRVGRPGDDPSRRIELSCSIWRYHPTRHVFEVVADGTINPWGLDFDDHGQGFLTTSVVEHLWHLVPGAHYERWKDRGVHPDPHVYESMTATSDHLHWAESVSDRSASASSGRGVVSDTPHNESVLDFGGGHSHCDAMIYLGDRWPAAYRGALLTSNIHGRRINQDRLIRQEGPYRGVHDNDFLVAADPWFRAVSMEYGPDGDVYVTDWSDNGECHDRDGVHRNSGRIYKISWGKPVHVDVDLFNASDMELVDYQLHRNDWFVRHSRRILQERAAAGADLSQAIGRLQAIVETHPDVSRKLRALWMLHCCDSTDKNQLVGLLDDDSDHLRSWAIRLLADQADLSPAVLDRFSELAATDTSWLVRITLASALRRVQVGKRWRIAISLASTQKRQGDPNLERMIWYAIEPEIAEHPERALESLDILTPSLRRWAARRITSSSKQSLTLLLQTLSGSHQPDVIADLLEGFNESLSLIDVNDMPSGAGHVIAALIDHANPRVRVAAVAAAAVTGDESVLPDIRSLLHNPKCDRETRRSALDGLAQRNPADFARDLERLVSSTPLALDALRAATKIDDHELAGTVIGRYAEFSDDERIAAIDYLVSRRSGARLLIRAVENEKIPATDLSASQSRQIDALGDQDLSSRLQQVWGTVRRTPAERMRQIRDLQRSLDPSRIATADLASGRELFRQTCAGCHKLFGDGKTVGPELTGANRRDLHYLVSNIVDPSAAVPADFRLSVVLTTDGRVISGTVSQQTETSLVIQTINGSVEVKAEDVESIKPSTMSLMPDGLLDKMTGQQIQDLFAWIMGDGLAE